MFDNAREYYNLEEVKEGLSAIFSEPVTPSMLYDYIRINKLIPYVLYSGVVYAAEHRTVFSAKKPTEVGLINMSVSCTAIFKASIDNIELLSHSIVPRIGYSSLLYTLEDLLTYKDDKMQELIDLEPIGYRLFSLDSEINENSKYELKCELKFKSRDLIQFSNQVREKLEFHNIMVELNEKKEIIKKLESENKSLKLNLNKYSSDKNTKQLHSIEKRNLINSLFKGVGIAVADYIWKMDDKEKVMKKRMVQEVQSILYNIQSPMLPEEFEVSKNSTIDEWLKDIVPSYANPNGRPKNEDQEKQPTLYMKK